MSLDNGVSIGMVIEDSEGKIWEVRSMGDIEWDDSEVYRSMPEDEVKGLMNAHLVNVFDEDDERLVNMIPTNKIFREYTEVQNFGSA